jgi:large subunit ribosomal protein L10
LIDYENTFLISEMNPDKQIMVDELLARINSSPFLIVTEYAGITVRQFSELRKRLRTAGSKCHVAKNSLVKQALRKVEAPDEIGDCLNGQTAIVTGESDICAAAKVLRDFAKEFSRPRLKSGLMDGKYLSAEQIHGLADLPPRPVLLAQLLGVLQAPGSKLVRTLNEPGASLARVLKAKADQAS